MSLNKPQYLVVSKLFVSLSGTIKTKTMKKPVRSISTIAQDINNDWKNVYFGAIPYLNAMCDLNKVTDSYGQDSARSVVMYFLSNAATWRGATARDVKKELNTMFK